jgi:hypothetical protein
MKRSSMPKESGMKLLRAGQRRVGLAHGEWQEITDRLGSGGRYDASLSSHGQHAPRAINGRLAGTTSDTRRPLTPHAPETWADAGKASRRAGAGKRDRVAAPYTEMLFCSTVVISPRQTRSQDDDVAYLLARRCQDAFVTKNCRPAGQCGEAPV